jgi:hypothetical protein
MFAAIGLVLLAFLGVGAVAVYLWVRRVNAWADAMIVSFGLMELRDRPELLDNDRNREEASSSNSREVDMRVASSHPVRKVPSQNGRRDDGARVRLDASEWPGGKSQSRTSLAEAATRKRDRV